MNLRIRLRRDQSGRPVWPFGPEETVLLALAVTVLLALAIL